MTSARIPVPPASRHRCLRRTESGPAVHLTLAGFITAAILVAGASPARMPQAPAVADALGTAQAPSHVVPRTVTAGASNAASRIDQLAAVVARRYKVADGAAADVVRTAFREGGRHGLDPMLILAVIAVESRFNPFAASEQGALHPPRRKRRSRPSALQRRVRRRDARVRESRAHRAPPDRAVLGQTAAGVVGRATSPTSSPGGCW